MMNNWQLYTKYFFLIFTQEENVLKPVTNVSVLLKVMVCARVHVHVCTCTCTCLCVCVCVYACACVCVCVCVCDMLIERQGLTKVKNHRPNRRMINLRPLTLVISSLGQNVPALTHRTPGPGCRTTSQPIYCQGGRKSASLVQLNPDAPTSQTGWQVLPCNPPFGIVTVFNFKCHGRRLAPKRCNLGWGSVRDVVVQCNPAQKNITTQKWQLVAGLT